MLSLISGAYLLLIAFLNEFSSGIIYKAQDRYDLPFDASMNTQTHTPQPIDLRVYQNLAIYANLIDISYCIDSCHQIRDPFQCDLCKPFASNMSLVAQWYFEGSICGYISRTSSNLFGYNESSFIAGKKTFIVSLRGTRSFHDTLTDLEIDMVQYKNVGVSLRQCGPGCKVHNGFWRYYRNTLEVMEARLKAEIDSSEKSYEVVFVGHSLGGSVALLLALHFLDMGYANVTLITMGQPLVGNEEFTSWADEALGSSSPIVHNSFARKFLRVIHKGDLVTTIPRNSGLFESYHMFENQVYINETADFDTPRPEQVLDCHSDKHSQCIAGDSGVPLAFLGSLYRNHNTYFRHMGLCGLHT